jgi:CMP-2-keto-3-deoxyoctulosonic acid synthetase
MTRDDVLCYRQMPKDRNEDPLHKWIGIYNIRLVILSRFSQWLHYMGIEDPKRRNEL